MEKEFIILSKSNNFEEIFEIFKDVVYYPNKENVLNILLDYELNNDKTLYGYLYNKILIGIIGIKNNIENIEVLHFGIHPEYRGKKHGTELMDYVKNKNKTIILSTDDDAIIFYEKYGFKYTKYFNEKYQKIRYNCIYLQ